MQNVELIKAGMTNTTIEDGDREQKHANNDETVHFPFPEFRG